MCKRRLLSGDTCQRYAWQPLASLSARYGLGPGWRLCVYLAWAHAFTFVRAVVLCFVFTREPAIAFPVLGTLAGVALVWDVEVPYVGVAWEGGGAGAQSRVVVLRHLGKGEYGVGEERLGGPAPKEAANRRLRLFRFSLRSFLVRHAASTAWEYRTLRLATLSSLLWFPIIAALDATQANFAYLHAANLMHSFDDRRIAGVHHALLLFVGAAQAAAFALWLLRRVHDQPAVAHINRLPARTAFLKALASEEEARRGGGESRVCRLLTTEPAAAAAAAEPAARPAGGAPAEPALPAARAPFPSAQSTLGARWAAELPPAPPPPAPPPPAPPPPAANRLPSLAALLGDSSPEAVSPPDTPSFLDDHAPGSSRREFVAADGYPSPPSPDNGLLRGYATLGDDARLSGGGGPPPGTAGPAGGGAASRSSGSRFSGAEDSEGPGGPPQKVRREALLRMPPPEPAAPAAPITFSFAPSAALPPPPSAALPPLINPLLPPPEASPRPPASAGPRVTWYAAFFPSWSQVPRDVHEASYVADVRSLGATGYFKWFPIRRPCHSELLYELDFTWAVKTRGGAAAPTVLAVPAAPSSVQPATGAETAAGDAEAAAPPPAAAAAPVAPLLPPALRAATAPPQNFGIDYLSPLRPIRSSEIGALPFLNFPPYVIRRSKDAGRVSVFRGYFDCPRHFSAGVSTSLILRGIGPAAYIFLNSTFIGYCTDDALTSEFDVSGALRVGTARGGGRGGRRRSGANDFANCLVLVVPKFAGAAAYMDCRDAWWLSGCFRDVELMQWPAEKGEPPPGRPVPQASGAPFPSLAKSAASAAHGAGNSEIWIEDYKVLAWPVDGMTAVTADRAVLDVKVDFGVRVMAGAWAPAAAASAAFPARSAGQTLRGRPTRKPPSARGADLTSGAPRRRSSDPPGGRAFKDNESNFSHSGRSDSRGRRPKRASTYTLSLSLHPETAAVNGGTPVFAARDIAIAPEDISAAECHSSPLAALPAFPSFSVTYTAFLEGQPVQLWSAERPFLYRLIIVLKKSTVPERRGKKKKWGQEGASAPERRDSTDLDRSCATVQAEACPVGFRSTIIRAGELLLNHRPVRIHGLARREFHPVLGRATSAALIREELLRLKASNFNALRLAGRPGAIALYEAAARLGFYIVDEPNCGNIPENNLSLFRRLWHHRHRRFTDDPDWSAAWESRTKRLIAQNNNFTAIILFSLGAPAPAGCAAARALAYFAKNGNSRPVAQGDAYLEGPFCYMPLTLSIDSLRTYVFRPSMSSGFFRSKRRRCTGNFDNFYGTPFKRGENDAAGKMPVLLAEYPRANMAALWTFFRCSYSQGGFAEMPAAEHGTYGLLCSSADAPEYETIHMFRAFTGRAELSPDRTLSGASNSEKTALAPRFQNPKFKRRRVEADRLRIYTLYRAYNEDDFSKSMDRKEELKLAPPQAISYKIVGVDLPTCQQPISCIFDLARSRNIPSGLAAASEPYMYDSPRHYDDRRQQGALSYRRKRNAVLAFRVSSLFNFIPLDQFEFRYKVYNFVQSDSAVLAGRLKIPPNTEPMTTSLAFLELPTGLFYGNSYVAAPQMLIILIEVVAAGGAFQWYKKMAFFPPTATIQILHPLIIPRLLDSTNEGCCTLPASVSRLWECCDGSFTGNRASVWHVRVHPDTDKSFDLDLSDACAIERVDDESGLVTFIHSESLCGVYFNIFTGALVQLTTDDVSLEKEAKGDPSGGYGAGFDGGSSARNYGASGARQSASAAGGKNDEGFSGSRLNPQRLRAPAASNYEGSGSPRVPSRRSASSFLSSPGSARLSDRRQRRAAGPANLLVRPFQLAFGMQGGGSRVVSRMRTFYAGGRFAKTRPREGSKHPGSLWAAVERVHGWEGGGRGGFRPLFRSREVYVFAPCGCFELTPFITPVSPAVALSLPPIAHVGYSLGLAQSFSEWAWLGRGSQYAGGTTVATPIEGGRRPSIVREDAGASGDAASGDAAGGGGAGGGGGNAGGGSAPPSGFAAGGAGFAGCSPTLFGLYRSSNRQPILVQDASWLALSSASRTKSTPARCVLFRATASHPLSGAGGGQPRFTCAVRTARTRRDGSRLPLSPVRPPLARLGPLELPLIDAAAREAEPLLELDRAEAESIFRPPGSRAAEGPQATLVDIHFTTADLERGPCAHPEEGIDVVIANRKDSRSSSNAPAVATWGSALHISLLSRIQNSPPSPPSLPATPPGRQDPSLDGSPRAPPASDPPTPLLHQPTSLRRRRRSFDAGDATASSSPEV